MTGMPWTCMLSSLAVVDGYSGMSTLPGSATLLGKFPTVQSMVGHGVACLLVFEHSYSLIQQGGHDWKEALVLSVNKYNASHIQTTIAKAIKAAFQHHGKNMAELCDEMLNIIAGNKMCK
ncbi:hypothetical protein EDC04DRAFT_2656205 [Pisolithus marmoratus]|nr:hypothetical protein EDC04DRAFT_2656205 [Pisolithus marmoratus]